MKNGQLKLNGKPTSEAHESHLLVRDISRYLSALAKLNDTEKIGNRDLSAGLRLIANALRPYAACPVEELADILKEARAANRRRPSSRKARASLPPNLESIDKQDVERILVNEDYTKDQVAELGFRRFGISRSKLKGLRKNDALNSVRAALEHENSLDVISKMARKAGKARAS